MITPVVVFDEIDSTNAEARRRAEAGETGPLWLTAARQTAGRGRRGRVWESPTGNLAATYLFTTNKPPGEAAQVSFVAALAVHEMAERFVAVSARSPGGEGPDHVFSTLKWPNDLLLNERKAAGVLVESGQIGGHLWVAAGMGVNLAIAPEPTPDAAIMPTSLKDEGVEPPTPKEAVAILSSAMDYWFSLWMTDGFPAIAAAWTARAHGLGQSCTARLPAETVVGIAEGLDGDGALRLRLPDGAVRRITAGDVFFPGAT